MAASLPSEAAAAAGAAGPLPSASVDDDEGDVLPLAEAMEEHMVCYDESLYYTCKEYEELHALFHKQQRRETPITDVPLRYHLLMLWSRPFATPWGKLYFFFQCALVLLSLCQLTVETLPEYNVEVFPRWSKLWNALELPTAAIFLLDLIAHTALLPSVPNDFSRYSRRTFMKKVEFWIDAITILPTLLSFFEDLVPFFSRFDFLKALRVLRFMRVLRQFHSGDQLAHTLEKSLEPLLGPCVFLFGIIIVFSGALFFAERGEYDPVREQYMIDDCDCLLSARHEMNPMHTCAKVPSKFVSLPQAMWFCITSMTTVGYGDIVPVCFWGRFCAVLCILSGNVLTAMPIAIVGSYFTDVVVSNRRRTTAAQSKTAFGKKDPNKHWNDGAERQSDAASGAAAAAKLTPFSKLARRQQFLATGGMSPPHSAFGDTPNAGGSGTIAERLLEALSRMDDDVDLLSPSGAVTHTINAFAKTEFDAVVTQMQSRKGAQLVAERCQSLSWQASLELESGPTAASLSPSVPLTRPLCFVIGAPGVSTPYCLEGGELLGLPKLLFCVYLDPVRWTAHVTAVFPARVKINNVLVAYHTSTRLLVGDCLTVCRLGAVRKGPETADRETGIAPGNPESSADGSADPPVLAYQFVRDASADPQTFAFQTQSARLQQQRGRGDGEEPAAASVHTIRLRPLDAPPEYRSLPFSAYAPVYREGVHRQRGGAAYAEL